MIIKNLTFYSWGGIIEKNIDYTEVNMDKRLQKYVEKKKQKFLIEEGLFDKVYEPEDLMHDVDEFPYSEKSNGINPTRYYKIIPYNISDEEFEILLKLHSTGNISNNDSNVSNRCSVFMMVVAIAIYTTGFIVGIMMGQTGYDFNFGITIIYWIVSFATGSLFVGISEIIKLLNHK